MTGNISTRSVGTDGAAGSEPKSPTPMGGASVSEVLARLEAAECGSRELDVSIWDALGGWSVNHPPAYTTSLDAALALAERVLPGWGFFLRKDKDGCNCGLVYPEASFVTPGCGSSPTPALALCIAILKARQASNPTAEGK